MTAPAVLKFGGSNFTNADDFLGVADYLCARLEQAKHIVAVTSAMTGETNRLQALLNSVHSPAPGWIQDAVLATGEVVSAHVLAAALTSRGVDTEVLDAPRLGIRTDSSFTRAVTEHFDPVPLRRALSAARAVVVAGGQAVDTHARTTMLGRNSSDLSAILVASALGSQRCEIFSDVSGVFSADPYLVDGARVLPELPYEAAQRLSVLGAKVLHHTAVAEAACRRVRIFCKKLQGGRAVAGTIVGSGDWPYAVVLNRAVSIAVFADARSRAEAAERLCAAAYQPFEIDRAGCPALACAVDAAQATRHLQMHGPMPSYFHTTPMVSVISPHDTWYECTETVDAARVRAQQLHDAIQAAAKSAAPTSLEPGA